MNENIKECPISQYEQNPSFLLVSANRPIMIKPIPHVSKPPHRVRIFEVLGTHFEDDGHVEHEAGQIATRHL